MEIDAKLVNMHLLDSMKPSTVTGDFNPKTYYMTTEQGPKFFGRWSPINDALQQPLLRIQLLTNGNYLPTIPLDIHKLHVSLGGRPYPITAYGSTSFAIPYMDIDNGINGNGFKFEPEKSDIVWWFRNHVPFSRFTSYSMFIYNEPTNLYIYMETKYVGRNSDGTQYYGWVNNGNLSFVVTSEEYRNGKFPYKIRYNSNSKECIVIRENTNDAPVRENPFYDLVRPGYQTTALFSEVVEGHKGSNPSNWTMQVAHDPSGAYHSFRSYGRELDPNDYSIVKPYGTP